MDARGTKKNDDTFYGYKNHIKADAETVIITDFIVTHAAVHDSQPVPALIGPQNKGENLFWDCAYKSAEIDEQLAEWRINNWIHEKGARNRPLNDYANDHRASGRGDFASIVSPSFFKE